MYFSYFFFLLNIFFVYYIISYKTLIYFTKLFNLYYNNNQFLEFYSVHIYSM